MYEMKSKLYALVLNLSIALALLFSGCSKVIKNAQPNKAGTLPVTLSSSAPQSDAGQPGIILPEAAKAGSRGVIEISEKMFIANVNDVYLNPDDYLGKNIRLEGIYTEEYYGDADKPYCFVLRYGPGCCGGDQNAGFEVFADSNNPNLDKPKGNDWVEAQGVLGVYEEDGCNYLSLRLTSLKIKQDRGAERVYQ
jgi:hypothetical protein